MHQHGAGGAPEIEFGAAGERGDYCNLLGLGLFEDAREHAYLKKPPQNLFFRVVQGYGAGTPVMLIVRHFASEH